MQYLHWTAQHKQTGIVHRPGVMLYPALIICLRMNRRLVYQFCCCFGDAFISRFKECLNMKCLEIRKKSNLKEKYYCINQWRKTCTYCSFRELVWSSARKIHERDYYHAETERLFIRFIEILPSFFSVHRLNKKHIIRFVWWNNLSFVPWFRLWLFLEHMENLYPVSVYSTGLTYETHAHNTKQSNLG